MYKTAKITWILAVVVATIAAIRFLIIVIADRNSYGPTGPFVLYFVAIPTLVFVIISTVLLVKNIVPGNKIVQIFLVIFLVIFTLVFSLTLFTQPSYERLMREIEEDNRKSMEANTEITADGKYRYRFYLVGRLTSSPKAHISVEDVANGDNFSITIDLKMEGLKEAETLLTRLKIELVPTDLSHIYILTTTENLKDEIERFEIDMIAKTSRRIE